MVKTDLLLNNSVRCLRLIREAKRVFHLDLSGRTVLTEAATGYYALTPMIAALAGADQVYALTRNSSYGSMQQARDLTLFLAQEWGVADRVEVLFSREDQRIGLADIITNLGFVRPIDASFLKKLKSTAVISLMFETWEYRSEDLDLNECRILQIPVLGTNEHHPDLRLFEYIGLIVLKLLFEIENEIFRSNIAVIGSGEFGEHVARSLSLVGAQTALIAPTMKDGLKTAKARQIIQKTDVLVVVEHMSRNVLIGKHGEITVDELSSLNPGLEIIHVCGGVDGEDLKAGGFRIHPNRIAPPGFMSVATDYLGPRPLVELHTAGLKIGEEMARARTHGLSGEAAEHFVLQQTTLAQAFARPPQGETES